MSSYFITGVSRGIGFAFLQHLSNDPTNTVIGLARNKTATDAKVAAEMGGRSNIHVIQGDMNKYDDLKKAVEETTKITDGRLDYLVANAVYVSQFSSYDGLGVLGNENSAVLEEDFFNCFRTNVVANVHLFNLFMPLILNGDKKKVITLSSGMADNDLVAKYELEIGGPYSVSKAAMNTVVAKFSAQYAKDGVLFIGICPGTVETGLYANITEDQAQKVTTMFKKFQMYSPHFTGPVSPEEAVKSVISVWERSSVANKDGGAFLSHFGNKQWI